VEEAALWIVFIELGFTQKAQKKF